MLARVCLTLIFALAVLQENVTCKKASNINTAKKKLTHKLPKKTDYGVSDKVGPDGRHIPNAQPINDNHGFPMNNGKLTGKARVKKDKIKYDDVVRAEEHDLDVVLEYDQMASQMEFNKWEDDFIRAGARPPINSKVQSFIDASGKPLSEIETIIMKKIKEHRSSRKRRSTIQRDAGVWNKCIIPYTFDPAYYADEASKAVIHQGMALIEKFSGFRYHEYAATNTTPGDNSRWGLNHNNYLKFVNYGGCWSYVGNLANIMTNGQLISPCGYMEIVVHELGHVLGELHENMNPVSMDWIRPIFENIDPAYRQNYHRLSKWMVTNFDETLYDPSSVMHYPDWGFNINYGKTLTMHDSDDDYLLEYQQHNIFYMLLAAQQYHGCFSQFPSCETLPTCSLGGGASVINGVCQCWCPEGLEPTTGCTTKYETAMVQWPSGTYSMLKSSNDDCPAGFDVGVFKQYPWYYHWQGGTWVDPPEFDWWTITQKYCTKSNTATGQGNWPPGSYCILRKGGACPPGFTDGRLSYYAGAAGNISGVLPDGLHNIVTEYLFCCRDDGYWNAPIELPTNKSFILFLKDSTCQKVKGTYDVLEYFNFQHDPAHLLVREGSLPFIYSFEFYSDPYFHQHFNVYYCAYIPITSDGCGTVKTFTESETEYTFTTPGYPGLYPPHKQCVWHFTSPVGTTMKLDFDTFEVSAVNDEQCSSFVEVKNWLPGFSQGFKFCGSGYQRTIWTKYNTLMVKFVSDFGQQWTGFSARVTIVKDESKCYTGDGSNGVYSGNVNYVKEFKPCIPWNKIKNCPFNQFDERTFDDDLDSHNYCRNTGVGQRPWCYIDEETCERQECDACATGKCFDIFEDCASIITADANYCSKNELGEAHRGCMASCGLCTNHVAKQPVSQVSCSMPEDVQGIGPNIQPGRMSFPVGSIVEYTCPTTGHIRTRVCTSEGSWSHLHTVCGVCPSGWSVYNKRCYKWLGYKEAHNYWTAKSMCEAMDARLPKVDSADINQFLFELIDMEKLESDTFWLGLKKRTGDNIWRWRDGSVLGWSNWADGQPDYSGECASFHGDDGKWYDDLCDTNLQYVVCETEFQDANSPCNCEDGRDDCAAILASDPDLCIKQTDYAWHNCRLFCGIEACNSGGICDDSVTNLGSSGQRIRGTSQVNVGDYTEYKCNSGYYLTSGNIKRACLPGGTLTGSPPVCSNAAIATSVELFPDVVIRRRTIPSDWGFILTSNNANMLITIPGKITTWKYYSNLPGEVAFIVLRQIAAGSYTVVGKNIVSNTPDDRKSVVHVVASQQITVQVNDMVALYVQGDEISYTMCDPAIMPQHTGWSKSEVSFSTAAFINVGTSYIFNSLATDEWGYCRFYSLQATVDP